MEFLIIVVVVIVGYFIYKAVQQNRPENKDYQKRLYIDQLDTKAEAMYQALVDYYRDNIKESSISYDKETSTNSLDNLIEVKDKYIKLRERFKHELADKLFHLARDWHDYIEMSWSLTVNADLALQGEKEFMTYADAVKATHFRKQEIIQRFDNWLNK